MTLTHDNRFFSFTNAGEEKKNLLGESMNK